MKVYYIYSMDSLLPENKITTLSSREDATESPHVPTSLEHTATPPPFQETPEIHPVKNVYPVARHIILILSVLMFLAIIILLMLLNGKSIYDNGL